MMGVRWTRDTSDPVNHTNPVPDRTHPGQKIKIRNKVYRVSDDGAYLIPVEEKTERTPTRLERDTENLAKLGRLRQERDRIFDRLERIGEEMIAITEDLESGDFDEPLASEQASTREQDPVLDRRGFFGWDPAVPSFQPTNVF